jgi:hypothetical protein
MAMNNYLDFFTGTALIEAIAKQPYIPQQTAELFETRSLAGTKLALEEQPAQGGSAITESSRGTASKTVMLNRRKVHTFDTKHYRADGSVYADEVLNMRGAGSNAAGELVTQRRDAVLQFLRNDLDFTLEALRLNTLLSPTNTMGTQQATQVIAFQTTTTATRQEIFNKIFKPLETALAGVQFTGVNLYCADDFWAQVVENKAIKDTYLLSMQAQAIRGDARDGFSWGGINFIRYRGQGATAITSGKAIAVPLGVPNLLVQGFAPADTLDQVGAGALGQPYYAQAYGIDDGNRGWHIEMQTNPVMVCTRPDAIINVSLT